MSTNISTTFLGDIEKTNLSVIWNRKIQVIAKGIPGNKSKTGDITISSLKLYYKAMMTKTALFWQRKWYVYQWNTIREAEKQKYPKYLRKGLKAFTGGKISPLINGTGNIGYPHDCIETHISLGTKLRSKWMKDLSDKRKKKQLTCSKIK